MPVPGCGRGVGARSMRSLTKNRLCEVESSNQGTISQTRPAQQYDGMIIAFVAAQKRDGKMVPGAALEDMVLCFRKLFRCDKLPNTKKFWPRRSSTTPRDQR